MAQSTVGVKIEASGGTVAVAELAKVRTGLSGLAGASGTAAASTDRARATLTSLSLSGPRAQAAVSQVAYSFERMALTGNITGEALRGIEGGLRLLTPSAGWALIGLTAIGTGFTALAAAIQGANDKYDRHLDLLRIQGPAQTAAEKIAQLRAELARLIMVQTPRPFAQGWLWALLGGSPASFHGLQNDIRATARVLAEAEANYRPEPTRPERGKESEAYRRALAEQNIGGWWTPGPVPGLGMGGGAPDFDRVLNASLESARRTRRELAQEMDQLFQDSMASFAPVLPDMTEVNRQIQSQLDYLNETNKAWLTFGRYAQSGITAALEALTSKGGSLKAAAAAFLGALRQEFLARSAGEVAMGIAALAFPAKSLLTGESASGHFAAAAAFASAAALAGQFGGGGGGAGGGGAAGYASNTREAIGSRGEVTIVLEGGRFLDLGDPRQLEAFRRAMEEFNGRRVVIRGG